MSSFLRRKMKAEYILEPKQKIDVKEKQTLKNLLTQEQVADLQCGKIVATCGGTKLNLEDEIKETILILTPLQGG
jgi:sulfur carrier protein ThiS